MKDAQQEGSWLPVETMPYDCDVEVKTLTGLLRLARRACGEGVRPPCNGKPANVHCWRKPKSGDLYAVAWRAAHQRTGEAAA